VDIIVVDHDDAAKAARQATERIPIVGTALSDPVEQGLIQSFARPGGNLTGVADLRLELAPKRLEVFCAMLPALKRILFLYSATDPYAVAEEAPRRCAPPGIVSDAGGANRRGGGRRPSRGSAEEDRWNSARCCALNLPGLFSRPPPNAAPNDVPDAFWVERGAPASYGPDLYASGGWQRA
jgi:putative ABC transport system substrate-binding protein